MKRAKTWKQRIFASLVAVCMVITLVPATAMAAGETETPGQLVDKVTLAKPDADGLGSDYKNNMDAIIDVDYQPANNKIIVTANRDLMHEYLGGGGKQTYYALVMNFDGGHLGNITASGDYKIEHGEGDSANDVCDKFVPNGLKQGYKNSIVFWLDAARDSCTFTLKDDESNKTQTITVEINDISNFVTDVKLCKEQLAAGGNSIEKPLYEKNRGALYSVNWSSSNNTITVIADRSQMKAYDRGRGDGEQLYYALAIDFSSVPTNVSAEGYNIEAVDRANDTYLPDGGDVSNQIVFWLNAEKDDYSFTLYKQTMGLRNDRDTTNSVTFRATQKIIVKVMDPIVLDKATANVKQGETVALKATAGGSPVAWTSEHDEIAIVGQNGVVAGISPGTTNIIATTEIGTKQASAICEVTVTDSGDSEEPENPDDPVNPGQNISVSTVTPQEAAIALDKTKATIYVKAKTQNTVRLKAIVLGKSKTVTWKSSKPKVATVKNGKVTAKKAGKTTITATANGVSAKCVVTVKKPALKLTKKKATIKKGKMVQIKVKATPQGGKIKYKSNKKKVATVNADGLVKGKKKGTAKITVTANGVKKTFTVRVK